MNKRRMTNIKKMLRQKLSMTNKRNENNNRYNFGCVMADLKIPNWNKIQTKIDEDDVYYTDDDSSFGRENNPHITILYGLHEDIDDNDIINECKKINNLELSFGDVSAFKAENYDVLKFNIISDDLKKLNKIFKKFPHTSTYSNYIPHATICYCKSGTSDKYIKIFKDYKIENYNIIGIKYSKTNKDIIYIPFNNVEGN